MKMSDDKYKASREFNFRQVLQAVLPQSTWLLARRVYRELRSRTYFSLDYIGQTTVRKVRIKLGISSRTERYRMESFSSKEPETLDWLEKNLTCGDIFFDIGANIGQYSIYGALREPGSKVYSFEPESQNFARLCRNVILNKIQNIIPCGFPLADSATVNYFFVSHLSNGCSLHSFGSPSQYSVDVPILRQLSFSNSIDALVESGVVPAPTLIKLDVDGIENKILFGAKNALASGSVKTLLVETSRRVDQKCSETEVFLAQYGYKVVTVSEWEDLAGDQVTKNYIFSR